MQPKVSKGIVAERARWAQMQRRSMGNHKERQRDYVSSLDRSESPLAGRWGRAPCLKCKNYLEKILLRMFGFILTAPYCFNHILRQNFT